MDGLSRFPVEKSPLTNQYNQKVLLLAYMRGFLLNQWLLGFSVFISLKEKVSECLPHHVVRCQNVKAVV